MPNLTYTASDFLPFTTIVSADVNSRFNDIKTLLNTTKLDSTNVQQYGLTRDRLAAGTANHAVINDSSGYLSSEAQLNRSRGGTGVDLSTLTGQQGKAIVVNAGETAFSLGTPTVDRVTETFAGDVATLVSGETISANDAVCIDLDNNVAYRVFKSDPTKPTRTNGHLGIAQNAATATAHIQTLTFSAALVASNVIAYTLNGRAYSTTYSSSSDATMSAIAAQIATDPDINSASVTGASPYRVITVTGTGALPINFTSVGITGGASQATITIATTQNYAGQNVQIRCFGPASGLSSLSPGYNYYLDSVTAGAITSTPTDSNPVFVGQAISSTVLFVNRTLGSFQFPTPSIFVRSHGSSGTNSTNGATNSEHFNFVSWAAGTADTGNERSVGMQGESALGGYHLVSGGLDNGGSPATLNTLRKYNKTAWSSGGTFTTARAAGGCGVLANNFYQGSGSGTSYTGSSTDIDKYNGTTWSSAVGAFVSSVVGCAGGTVNSKVSFVGGVDTSNTAVATHVTFDGSSVGSATNAPDALEYGAGSRSTGSKAIFIEANNAGGASKSYTWSGSAWSSNYGVGAYICKADYNPYGPGTGYSTGTAQTILNGGFNGSSAAQSTTFLFNGSSWNSSTGSSTSRGGCQGNVF